MSKKSPARIALENLLVKSPVPTKDAVSLIAEKVPSSIALRRRAQCASGAYFASLSQRVVAGQRNIARQTIDNAIADGAVIVRNGLLTLVREENAE